MTVAELIIKLQAMPQEALVEIEYDGGDGCDTCGHGGETQSDLAKVIDLETRVVLSVF